MCFLLANRQQHKQKQQNKQQINLKKSKHLKQNFTQRNIFSFLLVN